MTKNYYEIREALKQLDKNRVLSLVDERLKAGEEAYGIAEALREALEEIGDLFEREELFIPEMMSAANIFNSASSKIEPYIREEKLTNKGVGKFIIGTVQGDMHSLGKNLVSMMLRYSGFQVIDMGVDVPVEEFIKAVKHHKPKILGLSALLTTTMKVQAKVINALTENGLRDSLKVIVGGAPVDQEWANKIAADAYGENAVDGVRKSLQLLTEGVS